jgi:peptidyl-prolyl cis-trans isomerase SurA
MNKTVASLLLAAIFSLAATGHAEPQPLDKVIAVVDKSVIMQSELDERLFQVVNNARANNLALPDVEALRKQVLDHLISEHLQLQTAKRVGFQVTDEQVNQSIEQIRRSNQLSPQQFAAQLEQDGLTMADLREKLRRDITIQQIQQGMVQQRIHISPLEIDNFLKSADAQFWISPEYHLGHILFSLSQSASAEDVEAAKQKAEDVVKKIRAGANFAELAIAESDGPAALNGGDLGWRKTSDLPSLFAELLPPLQPGDVSEPARSPAGFHILKVYDKRGGEQQTEQQTKVRHILLKPSAILSDEDAKAKLEKLRQRILNGEDFAALAKEHSEDIGSMLAGGDLGWSRPGMFVAEFENTMAQMDVGEISQPFRSQFGWHILQVEERRQEDITDDILRDKAARILTSRRFEDELQIWLREMRDEAFINIKI